MGKEAHTPGRQPQPSAQQTTRTDLPAVRENHLRNGPSSPSQDINLIQESSGLMYDFQGVLDMVGLSFLSEGFLHLYRVLFNL